MELIKITVVVFGLVARTCRGEIVIATPNQDESTPSLVDDLAHVVASCYRDRIQVGLIGDVRDDLARTLSQHLIPVVLIDSSPSYTHTWKTQFHHKLNVFIADVESPDQFGFIIENRLKSSIYWNHMASVFIFDRSAGCDNTAYYLQTAWANDLLNAKFLCHHIEAGRVIATFNPFTKKAPTPWLHIGVSTFYDHPFTLLYREYRRNAAICVNLDFDKTEDLGGYPAIILGSPLGYEVRHTPNLSQKQDWRRQDRIIYTLVRTLHISPIFTKSIDYYDIVKDDIVFPGQLETTYPFRETELVIIAQFTGHKSQLKKILFVIDVDARIGLGIVYLITLIFLKFFVRQALMPAFLNLVRITCDSGFTNLPDNTASRIYMTSLLFFAVTMQGIYQGNLAALLTQCVPLRQVETAQDVVDFGYKLYGHSELTNLIDHLKLEERFTAVEERENCVAYVINDSSAACLWIAEGGVLDLAREFNLHISSEPVQLYYQSLETRFNWPLQTKVEVFLRKLVEGDMLEPWNDKCNPTKLSDFQIDTEVRKNKAFKNIELGELAFSFVILGIGLLCASIIFIIELAIQYKCIFVD